MKETISIDPLYPNPKLPIQLKLSAIQHAKAFTTNPPHTDKLTPICANGTTQPPHHFVSFTISYQGIERQTKIAFKKFTLLTDFLKCIYPNRILVDASTRRIKVDDDNHNNDPINHHQKKFISEEVISEDLIKIFRTSHLKGVIFTLLLTINPKDQLPDNFTRTKKVSVDDILQEVLLQKNCFGGSMSIENYFKTFSRNRIDRLFGSNSCSSSKISSNSSSNSKTNSNSNSKSKRNRNNVLSFLVSWFKLGSLLCFFSLIAGVESFDPLPNGGCCGSISWGSCTEDCPLAGIIEDVVTDHWKADDHILKYGPMKNWDMSQVTNMDDLFNNLITSTDRMARVFVSNWDVSKVTTMERSTSFSSFFT